MPKYKSKSVTHTYFCCLSSSRSQRLFIYIWVFLLLLAFPVFFPSSRCLFVLSCPLRFSFLFVLPSVFSLPSYSLYSSLPRLHLLLPFTRSGIYIAPTQTVHGNELSASLRHSQWCGRSAAPLSLSVSAFIFLSLWWNEGCLSSFPSTWWPRSTNAYVETHCVICVVHLLLYVEELRRINLWQIYRLADKWKQTDKTFIILSEDVSLSVCNKLKSLPDCSA